MYKIFKYPKVTIIKTKNIFNNITINKTEFENLNNSFLWMQRCNKEGISRIQLIIGCN